MMRALSEERICHSCGSVRMNEKNSHFAFFSLNGSVIKFGETQYIYMRARLCVHFNEVGILSIKHVLHALAAAKCLGRESLCIFFLHGAEECF